MKELPKNAAMADYQTLIHSLESHHGWLDVDLIHNCFLMGEEVGELFGAIRQYEAYFKESSVAKGRGKSTEQVKEDVAEEIVDVINYLLAIANRLNIDVETAFRKKNARNFKRSWNKSSSSS